MKNGRRKVELAAVIVVSLLIGAAIAQTLLAQSEDFTVEVTNKSPMEIAEFDHPEGPIVKGVWYDQKPIHFKIINHDGDQDYNIYMRLTISGPLLVQDDVIAQYRHRAGGEGDNPETWQNWYSITLSEASGTLSGSFANGFYIAVEPNQPYWIEFEIRFMVAEGAPPDVTVTTPVEYTFLLELFEWEP